MASTEIRVQSIIARAADDNCFVVMDSLDLSMAFDMVNTELLNTSKDVIESLFLGF